MRVLIVGADTRYAIERPYLKYISQNRLVSNVELFTAQNQFLEYYHADIINKFLYRVGFSTILNDINDALKKRIEEVKPNVVLVFKGMEIFPATLKWIRGLNIKLANYNPDNPFIFSGKGSGNMNLREAISLYDLHLTYQRDVKEQLEREYSITTRLLPFGFDVSDEIYQACLSEEEIMRTCFLGNPDKYRARFVNKLAHAGLEIDVYGHGWNKFVNHPLIAVHDAVYADEFWKTLRKYRVQLNLMRPHNPNAHNMRSFEIPAVGGIQLAPYTLDHKTYFEPGKEIILYQKEADCYERIKELLSWPKEKADEIRTMARKRSLVSEYSYKDRAAEVVRALQSLLVELAGNHSFSTK